MPGLLVSVRSAEEARAALAGGAELIDVKEPDCGPLGMADPEVWQAVRQELPRTFPVSVALGDLADWESKRPPGPHWFNGIAFRKLGLAAEARRRATSWQERFQALMREWGAGPAWIAVAYSDWKRVAAPAPESVLEFAIRSGCRGVLVDTWDKGSRSRVGADWQGWVGRARSAGLFVALAGGLDAAAIRRLAPLAPTWFAVRGAACVGSRRASEIDTRRVKSLAALLRSQGAIRSRDESERTCTPSQRFSLSLETQS
jgi:uncharacterized protein (UPF0264 family)